MVVQARADTTTTLESQLWDRLAEIPDPEIPILTLTDLGIIRFVREAGDSVTVGVAPTYSGCPATEVIHTSIVALMRRHGVKVPRIERVLSPPWTTDWISDTGRKKLLAYGIAPPAESVGSKRAVLGQAPTIACPRCTGTNTQKVSEFGSTPCKASYKCGDCLEPFEYFKCI